jgi:predicted secreted hydrolase
MGVFSALAGCFGLQKEARPDGSAKKRARLGILPEHYAKLGLEKGTVAQWEDGTRTGFGCRGTYEWWYFDAHLEDGTSLVIVFFTKPMVSPRAAPDPHVMLTMNTPDGKEYMEVYRHAKGEGASASTENCDIRIGRCYFRGNLREYEIYFRGKTAEAKITLRGSVPPWRPETGHIFFGDNDEYYFAWLPAVPEGTVTAEITQDGRTRALSGTGYHDHNWGNINMLKVMHRWYWGRARVGDYRVISSYIWAEKKYGYREFPVFMIAGENRILADNAANLSFTAGQEFVEKETGKPAHNLLVYDYRDDDAHFRISYKREKSVLNFMLADNVGGVPRLLAKLAGFDGAYHRFTGKAILERLENGKTVERVEAAALWELMYFGKAPRKD